MDINIKSKSANDSFEDNEIIKINERVLNEIEKTEINLECYNKIIIVNEEIKNLMTNITNFIIIKEYVSQDIS